MNYYKQHWHQMQRIAGGEWEKLFYPVIAGFVAWQRPVGEKILLAFAQRWNEDLTLQQVRRTLKTWDQWLTRSGSEDHPMWFPYHTTFQQFLAERDDISVSEIRQTLIMMFRDDLGAM